MKAFHLQKVDKIYPINKPQSSFNMVKDPHPTPPKSYEK